MMHLLDLREPASAVTHALGFLAAVLGLGRLWWGSAGAGRSSRLAVLAYGLSLAGCLGASAAYHAAPLAPGSVAALRRVDHIGIHLLIAGTYTPIAWTLLRGRMRSLTLGLAWGIAAIGSAVLVVWGVLPPWLCTAVYLGAGWGAFFAYFEITRTLGHRATRPIFLGGLAYSVGALLNVAGWPVLRPGVFEAHEVFHLFVLAGAALHYRFIATVVATHRPEVRSPQPGGRVDAPHDALPTAPAMEIEPGRPARGRAASRPAVGSVNAPGAR